MTREEADLFVSDVQMIAEGIERFFARIDQTESLQGRSLVEIVNLIQGTGALENASTIFASILSRIPGSLAQDIVSSGGAFWSTGTQETEQKH